MFFIQQHMSTASPDQAASAAPVTTTVLGYLNPKTYNVSISSDQMGINVVIPSKQYMVDREGRKINDPRLDAFVRGGLLVKEYSPTPVPLIALRPNTVQISPATSVTAQQLKAPVTGVIPAPGKTIKIEAQPPGQPMAGSPSVGSMSIEQARKLGIIGRPTADKFERAPDEDKDGAAARNAPYIDQVGVKGNVVKNAPALQTVADAAKAAAMNPDSPDTIDEALRSVAAEAGVKVQAAGPVSLDTKAMKKVVTYDDKPFVTPGDLRKYLRRKFKDNELAEEALQPLLPLFK